MRFLILKIYGVLQVSCLNQGTVTSGVNEAIIFQDAMGNTELHNYLHPFDLAQVEIAIKMIKELSKEALNYQNTYGETVVHRMLKCTHSVKKRPNFESIVTKCRKF